MKNGLSKGLMAGALVSAGALWAVNNMNKRQKRQLGIMASRAANKVLSKTGDLIK